MKTIKQLEAEIAECNYKLSGYFPLPFWKERLEKLTKQLKKLKEKHGIS